MENNIDYEKCLIENVEGETPNQEVADKEYQSKKVDKPIKKSVPKTQVKKCKVIMVTKDKVGVDFDTYGISFDVDNTDAYKVGNTIDIEYSGEIGKCDFKAKIK